MVIGPESILKAMFETKLDHAVVYADEGGEAVLHEGTVRVLGNGWVELPSGRLLSPSAVHHIDEGRTE